MNGVFQTVVERVIARVTGPLSLRFVLQPAMAILLGIRDGRLDARAGAPPFGWALVFKKGSRGAAIKSALHALLVPIVVGRVMVAVAQYLIFHQVRPGFALLVGTLVMGLPYVAARGISNRIITAMKKREEVGAGS